MRRCIPILFAAVALFHTGCNAGEHTGGKAVAARGQFLERSYFFKEAKKDISYTLYVPTTYDKTRKTPLVVLLHGLGSNPRQIMRYQGITKEAEARGYVVVAPYGYNERGWYGSRGKGKEGRFFGKPTDPDNLGELSEKDVLNVLGIVRAEFTIDEKRIYLLGHSMGGGGALHLAGAYPDIWSGLAALAPSFQAPLDRIEKLKHLPAMVVTGTRDFLVPVRTVRRLVEKMKALKMAYHYKEIQGGNHFLTITRNPAMIAEVFDFFDKLKGPEDKEGRKE